MPVTLYGLKTCDTCRKARRYLDNADIAYGFVDLRDNPIDNKRLAAWLNAAGWQALCNRRSRTWRELPAARRKSLDADSAPALLLQHPTLIKRPVLELPGDILVGFSAARYAAAIAGLN